MNLFFAFLADSKRALTDPAQRGPSIAELTRFAVEFRDRESSLGRALDFLNVIGILLHGYGVPAANEVLQLGDA